MERPDSGNRWVEGASRNALLAAVLGGAYLVRAQSRGEAVSPRKILFLGILLGLTFLVATTWRGLSKVDRWPWMTAVLMFLVSLVSVTFGLMILVVRLL